MVHWIFKCHKTKNEMKLSKIWCRENDKSHNRISLKLREEQLSLERFAEVIWEKKNKLKEKENENEKKIRNLFRDIRNMSIDRLLKSNKKMKLFEANAHLDRKIALANFEWNSKGFTNSFANFHNKFTQKLYSLFYGANRPNLKISECICEIKSSSSSIISTHLNLNSNPLYYMSERVFKWVVLFIWFFFFWCRSLQIAFKNENVYGLFIKRR